MIPTFRPWTHTSDDSYIYQLSLVVATATAVSFSFLIFVSSVLFVSFVVVLLVASPPGEGTRYRPRVVSIHSAYSLGHLEFDTSQVALRRGASRTNCS